MYYFGTKYARKQMKLWAFPKLHMHICNYFRPSKYPK